jgi:hypothetical protein
MARDYKAEYKAYQGTPEQIKNRAARNAARREMEKRGLVKKGDGKDVGHVRALSKGGNNASGNLQVQDRGENRSFSRTSNGSMRSETSRRER